MGEGRFDYRDVDLKYSIFGWSDKCWNALEDWEISELAWDFLELLHHFDRYKSGDTNEEAFLKEKAKFKAKWLSGKSDARVKRTIDAALEECRQGLYKTYGVGSQGKSEKINKE